MGTRWPLLQLFKLRPLLPATGHAVSAEQDAVLVFLQPAYTCQSRLLFVRARTRQPSAVVVAVAKRKTRLGSGVVLLPIEFSRRWVASSARKTQVNKGGRSPLYLVQGTNDFCSIFCRVCARCKWNYKYMFQLYGVPLRLCMYH